MHFSTALVAALASAVLAMPDSILARQDPDAVLDPNMGKAELEAVTNTSAPNIVYAEVLKDGLLELYSDPSFPEINPAEVAKQGGNDPQGAQARCGANTVRCSASNRARTGICGRLFDILGGTPGRPLPPASHYCWTDVHVTSNNRCCFSWSRRVTSTVTRSLFPAANKIMRQCQVNALVSGWSPDVNLGGVCVRQCLSNRPGGCN